MSDGWMPGATRKPDNDGTSKCYSTGPFELLALVEHIAEGSDSTWKWLFNEESAGGGPVSSTFFVLETGEIMQGMPITSRAWANGLAYNKAQDQYYDPQGHPVSPPWWRIAPGGTHRGQDPNKLTLSVEHSGYNNKPRTDAQKQATVKILQWVQSETGLIWLPGDTLIGHCDISPYNRANCPGQYFNLQAMADAGNAASDPLKVRKVPGVGRDMYCGTGFYDFWVKLGGVEVCGLALEDEVPAVDEQGDNVTKQGYERLVMKYKATNWPAVHLALRSEVAHEGW